MPKRTDKRKRLERTGISIPTVIVPGIDARAASLGMSRSAYVAHVLISEDRVQLLERLERAERRIKALEDAKPPELIRAVLMGPGLGDNGTAFRAIPRMVKVAKTDGQYEMINPQWKAAPYESTDGGISFSQRVIHEGSFRQWREGEEPPSQFQ